MIGGTPFVPTGSEGYSAQGGSKAARSSRDGNGATHSPPFAGEHGEYPPFDASEHRGTPLVAYIANELRLFCLCGMVVGEVDHDETCFSTNRPGTSECE